MSGFNDFALICLALGQTQSRLQMSELVSEYLATLDPPEAEIAARFMVGRPLAQGDEKRLQISGRAIWKIVAEMVGGTDQGEAIFAAATDFGEAIEMLLRLRASEPGPALSLMEVEQRFAEIAAIEGRNSRRLKLDALRDLFDRATTLEGKYLAKILIGEMRHGLSEGLMIEAIAKMAARPVAEVRRANMLTGDVGRVVRAMRAPAAAGPSAPTAVSAGAADALASAPDTAAPVAPGVGTASTHGASSARVSESDLVEPVAHSDAFASSNTASAAVGNTDAVSPSAGAASAPSGRGGSTSGDKARYGEGLEPSRALKPMLAQPAPNFAEAWRMLGDGLALEHKLDGARVQIHCTGAGARIYSRALNEITASLPEVVEMIQRLGPRRAIFDGEVIAIDSSGRALAFQEVMRRFGRVRDIERLRIERPVRLFVFDLIGLDGELLIDEPYEKRYAALSEIAAATGLAMPARILPDTIAAGNQFYARAIAEGYEGVVAKALASHYMPGARGRGWVKIKTARTFDLVIVAADWGYGRRHGWLSNYHLAARDERDGGFVEVGKTFKGLTDDDFRAMTERLLALKISETRGTVVVRPEVVVEVAYSDIQRSPRYAGGMALRFARIVGMRSDKHAVEADTIAAVAEAFDRQMVKPLGAGD